MSKTTVVNIKSKQPFDVYIGRAMPRQGLQGSPFQNPFHIGKDGDRETVISKYREHILMRTDLLEQLPSLRGKVLACWCKPDECHGDVLIELLGDN
jgi:hypothetical protein